MARPHRAAACASDPPGPVTWRRRGPHGRLAQGRGGRQPGPRRVGYAFFESPLSPPAPGIEVGAIPDCGLPAGYASSGPHSWDLWGSGRGSADPGLVREVGDPHREGEGRGACLQLQISEGPLRCRAPVVHPGSVGLSCKEAAFDPVGGALTELGPAPGTVLGASWAFPTESCPAAQVAACPARQPVPRPWKCLAEPDDSHLSGMLRKDSQRRAA